MLILTSFESRWLFFVSSSAKTFACTKIILNILSIVMEISNPWSLMAYICIGNIKEFRVTYQKVITLDILINLCRSNWSDCININTTCHENQLNCRWKWVIRSIKQPEYRIIRKLPFLSHGEWLKPKTSEHW